MASALALLLMAVAWPIKIHYGSLGGWNDLNFCCCRVQNVDLGWDSSVCSGSLVDKCFFLEEKLFETISLPMYVFVIANVMRYPL